MKPLQDSRDKMTLCFEPTNEKVARRNDQILCRYLNNHVMNRKLKALHHVYFILVKIIEQNIKIVHT